MMVFPSTFPKAPRSFLSLSLPRIDLKGGWGWWGVFFLLLYEKILRGALTSCGWRVAYFGARPFRVFGRHCGVSSISGGSRYVVC